MWEEDRILKEQFSGISGEVANCNGSLHLSRSLLEHYGNRHRTNISARFDFFAEVDYVFTKYAL